MEYDEACAISLDYMELIKAEDPISAFGALKKERDQLAEYLEAAAEDGNDEAAIYELKSSLADSDRLLDAFKTALFSGISFDS